MRNVKERVRLAREIETMDLQLRRSNDSKNWRKKAADDIGILDSDDSDNESKSNRNLKQINLSIKHKKLALGQLLATSFISSNIQSLKYPIGSHIETFESNPLELVKKLSQNGNKKSRKFKLFRKRK